MGLKKKDFIEIEFTGKDQDGRIFDSNIKKDLEKAGLKIEAKPFIFSLGEEMFIQGVDDFLIGKETGKEYNIELDPENAFGPRNTDLIKIIPLKKFRDQKLNPYPGATFNFDGQIARVLSVNGGRVRIDFNNPLAGKKVKYNLKVIRKIEDLNEKVKALLNFLFRKDFDFELKDKKVFVNVEKQVLPVVALFSEKFKDILGLELEGKEILQKKEDPKN